MIRLGRRVDPGRQQIVKFMPSFPPRRGEYVLVDGVRCVVTSCRVRWDGPRWTIISLRVRQAA